MQRLFILATILFAMIATAAAADDYKVGSLQISTPWARATPKGAMVGAGYMKITNTGTTPDRLIGGSSDAASKFELHVMNMQGGVMKMRPLANGLEIKPGESVELRPGGSHVMFVELKKPLLQGEHVHGTLVFEKAGKVDIDYDVAGIGASAPASGSGQAMPDMHGGRKMGR